MNPQIRVFDLERIFVGQLPWTYTLEIIFRTVFMYLFTLTLIRFIGKRGLRELTLFEYIINFALGSSVGDPMFDPEIPLLHGMAVVTAFVILHRALVVLSTKIPQVHGFVYPGETACLVRDGVMIPAAIRKERLAAKDLFMILREAGIEHLGQVRRAYLEPTGEVSVWRYKDTESVIGMPITPNCDMEHPEPVQSKGAVPESGIYHCVTCGRTLEFRKGRPFVACDCGDNVWIRSSA